MEEKILDAIAELCEDDIVKEDPDVELFETELMDSLAFTELLIAIETITGVIIPPTEVDRTEMDTPNKILAYVKARC